MSQSNIFAQRSNHGRYIEIHVSLSRNDDSIDVAQPVTFNKSDPCGFYAPMLRLDQHDAQSLMDELWNCGLRPTEGSGSAGSLAATERHLKDMQTIAFNALKIK